MILLTGAAGLLGVNFLLTALDKGIPALGVCWRRPLAGPGVQTVQADLTDENQVKELLTSARPAWVVHAAALADVDRCEQYPEEAHLFNVQMTRHLARWTQQVGAGFIYISTDQVFPGKLGGYAEADAPGPINRYGFSKWQAEQMVQAETDRYLIIRTNIFGWRRSPPPTLAEWIFHRLTAGEQIPGFTDVFFNPILVNELAEILLEMLTLDLQGIYHVAGSESLSKYNFAVRLAQVFSLEPGLVNKSTMADVALAAPRPKNMSLQTAKIAQALGRTLPEATPGLRRFKALQESGWVDWIDRIRRG